MNDMPSRVSPRQRHRNGRCSGSEATAIPIGWSRANRLYAIHTDHLGTPRRLTDDDNKPSGVLKATTNPNAALTNQPELLRTTAAIEFNLRFPGQYADSDTGLSYNYFRHYNPATGRYVQSDPIGLDGGVNRFGYVGGDPMGDIDPFGLANSGRTIGVPGGNGTTIRIDPPHVPGQKSHAHVCERGCKEIVVNKDGSGSHGTDPKKLKNRVKDFLRAKGFKLSFCPLPVEEIAMAVAANQCAAGDISACGAFQLMGGKIEQQYD